jgi:hypothetical protein
MAKKLSKLDKVNESFTINRYDNGWLLDYRWTKNHVNRGLL